MTQEELTDVFKYIVKKCDILINNDAYKADAYTQDTVEDIAELCNHILDGDYGKLMKEVQEEPVSEELDKAAENHAVERYKATRDMVLAEKCKWSFKAGAEWQEKKDQEIIETAIHHAYHNGKLEMKEQMMAKAVDAKLLEGHLIRQKGVTHPLHVGDKVKVIVIKED